MTKTTNAKILKARIKKKMTWIFFYGIEREKKISAQNGYKWHSFMRIIDILYRPQNAQIITNPYRWQ